MILTAAKAAGAAITGILAFSSGRNILQTYRIAKEVSSPPSASYSMPQTEPLLLPKNARPLAVRQLQSLTRPELLRMYLNSCEAPTDDSMNLLLDGEWNGVLLSNGPILTPVVGFITNRLFGKGRRWNGKAFHLSSGKGHNRFESVSSQEMSTTSKNKINDNTNTSHPQQVTMVIARTEDDQFFNFSLSDSRLGADSGQALILEYKNYQQNRLWSPWKSMVDEIRIVPSTFSNSDDCELLLLGWGSMGWSGGKLNASPFCLYRRRGRKEAAQL